MTLSIAVIGNSGLNIGAAMAGDLALAGHDVRFQLWDDQRDCLVAVRAEGGVRVGPPASETLSGRTGLGWPRILTDDPSEAVVDAELVVMDVVALELEDRAAQLIPHLVNGQVLHVNTHGYWPVFRLAQALREANKAGVIVTEGVTPTMAAGRSGSVVTPQFLRRQLPVAAFPANRRAEATPLLSAITTQAEPRRNVIETNLESMNLLIHPAMHC